MLKKRNTTSVSSSSIPIEIGFLYPYPSIVVIGLHDTRGGRRRFCTREREAKKEPESAKKKTGENKRKRRARKNNANSRFSSHSGGKARVLSKVLSKISSVC